jgi:hypothetical protein
MIVKELNSEYPDAVLTTWDYTIIEQIRITDEEDGYYFDYVELRKWYADDNEELERYLGNLDSSILIEEHIGQQDSQIVLTHNTTVEYMEENEFDTCDPDYESIAAHFNDLNLF